jgi:hypothetical protein
MEPGGTWAIRTDRGPCRQIHVARAAPKERNLTVYHHVCHPSGSGGIDHMYPDGHGQACPDSEGVDNPALEASTARSTRRSSKPRYRMRP